MKSIPAALRPLTRRHLLQGLGTTAALAALPALPPVRAASVSARPAAGDAARRQAAWRRRGVVYNNDGYDVFTSRAPATKEGFLSVRMDPIADCEVPTVFYCTMISSVVTHASKVLEVYGQAGGHRKTSQSPSNRIPALLRLGTDPLRLVIERCRAQKMEIFWTLRLNDIHDNWDRSRRAQWKHERPELVMATPEEAAGFDRRDPRCIWTLGDFERRENRDRMVRVVAEVLEGYDVDGVDLDFLRHTCYFKETRLGQPVTPAHRQLLTDMVRQMRALILAASARKGRPVLLSARVLETMQANQHHGLELDRWLDEGLLDFVLLGGFTPFTSPAKQLVDWCHGRDIPAYGCIVREGLRHAKWSGPPVPYAELTQESLEAWRGAAANTWALGVDGIMTFNLFAEQSGPKLCQGVLREIGDPKNLVAKDKVYGLEHFHDDDYCYLFRSVSRAGRLPVTIRKETTVTRQLPVADDIGALADRIKRLRLRLYLDHFRQPDQVSVRLNGTKLAAAPEQPQWLAADLPPRLVKKGLNELAVTFERGESASWTLTLRAVELRVQYG